MQHEYVKVVACACATFEIHLVIPSHFKTKGKSNHSVLRDFFAGLYENLKPGAINEVFFQFSNPALQLSHRKGLMGVKSECGTDVLAAVTKCANLHIEECILLANTMLPEVADSLSIQPGKLYVFVTHESEFLVFEQAGHVDKGKTHNLQMEQECDDHDNMLIKKCNISSLS